MIEFEQKLLKDVALSLPVSFKNPSGETLKPYAGEELAKSADVAIIQFSAGQSERADIRFGLLRQKSAKAKEVCKSTYLSLIYRNCC